jgi:hypothetical protein
LGRDGAEFLVGPTLWLLPMGAMFGVLWSWDDLTARGPNAEERAEELERARMIEEIKRLTQGRSQNLLICVKCGCGLRSSISPGKVAGIATVEGSLCVDCHASILGE